MALSDLLADLAMMPLQYVYHRWIDPPANPTLPPNARVQLPLTAPGSPITMLFGRVRVRQPVLVFNGTPVAYIGPDPSGSFTYALNMSFVLGIPFAGDANPLLWGVWAGEIKTSINGGVDNPVYPVPGHPIGGIAVNVAQITISPTAVGSGQYCAGPLLEFLDGNASQVLVDGSGVAQTQAGQVMLDAQVPADAIPGYRGVLLATCYDTTPNSWSIGPELTIPSYSFEASSFPLASLGPNGGQIADNSNLPASIAYDANPIDVIYDILTGLFGKLGLNPALIDIASFTAAAVTLYNEGHGYSNAIAGGQSAQQTIQDILKQIDGVLYTDPSTNTIKLKLIRADYNPQTIPLITPDNCEGLNSFALGGWTDVPNRIRATFNDRATDYNPNSALAINGSNSLRFGQQEVVIDYPGCTNSILARQLAARELAARSRPLAKCTAIVNRSFYTVCPGDAVAVTWPEANISGMVFRVAAVDRGTLKDGKISLDLIQDYFYQWRDQRPVPPGAASAFGGDRVAVDRLPPH